MNMLDRYLYQTIYFHGHLATAQQKVRAWAMVYNFMPLADRSKKVKEAFATVHSLKSNCALTYGCLRYRP